MVYILAVIGMICWGISPIFAKLGLKDANPLTALAIRTFFTTAVIFIWLLLSGHFVELKNISAKVLMLLIAEAALATVIGDLAYFAALKKGSASIVMLIMSCSPVVTIICSALFLGEKLNFIHIVGALLIMIGIMLVI